MANFPGVYDNSRYTQQVLEILARQGEIGANRAAQSGQIWANALGNIGQIGAEAYQQHQQQKDQKKREEMFNQALSSWDPANPGQFYRSAAVAFGPELATSSMRALLAIEESKRKGQPDPKLAAAKLEGIAKLYQKAPDIVKQNWSGIATALGPDAEAFAGIQLGPEWDDKYGQMLGALGPEQKVETRLVTVENPDGSKTQRIVRDEPGQVFESAAPPKDSKAQPTVNVGGRVKQYNPATNQFDIDLGASEAALNREAASEARAVARTDAATKQADKEAKAREAQRQARLENDDSVKAAFGAMKTALANVKAYAGKRALTSPLEAANARQQYLAAAQAFAATLSRATGDTRISDLDRKAYAGLMAYAGKGSNLLMITRPDLVEGRLTEAEKFFESAAKDRDKRLAEAGDGTPTGARGSGTEDDPYTFDE